MSVIIPANIVAFVTGIWGKVAGIALVVGLLAFGFRLWLNKHDDRIFQDGRNNMAVTMTKDYEAKLKVGMAEAKVMSETAAADRKAVEARLDELNARFTLIFASLREIKVAAEKREVVYVEKAGAVPASELDDALRFLSSDIARQSPH